MSIVFSHGTVSDCRKAIEDNEASLRVFDIIPGMTTVYTIAEITPDGKAICLPCSEDVIVAMNGLGKEKFPDLNNCNKISLSKLPDNVASRVRDGTLTTIIQEGQALIFVDDTKMRGQLADLVGVHGSFIYDERKRCVADVILADALKKAHPFQVVAHFHNGVAIGCGAFKNFKPTSILDLDIWNSKDFKLSRWYVSDLLRIVEFEAKAIGDFTPIVRITQSDAGIGSTKVQIETWVRNSSNENGVFVARGICLKDVEDAISRPKKLKAPKSIPSDLARTLGAKRTELKKGKTPNPCALLIEEALKLDEAGYIKCMLEIPDLIGSLNNTTDREVAVSIGKIFKGAA